MHCAASGPATEPNLFFDTGVSIRVSGLIVKSGVGGTGFGDRVSGTLNRMWVELRSRVSLMGVWSTEEESNSVLVYEV